MRILAVETNVGKLKRQFLNETEQEIITIPKHVFQFLFRALVILFWFALAAGAMAGLAVLGVTSAIVLPGTAVAGVVAGALILMAYAEWRFDFILITTDKMVVVDSSFFRQTVMPINLEHVSSVTAQTRYANIFRFGTLHFLLKDEPARDRLDVEFIPYAAIVAARISDVITDFQRRKSRMGAPVLAETAEQEQAMKLYEIQQNAQIQAATGHENPGSTTMTPGLQQDQVKAQHRLLQGGIAAAPPAATGTPAPPDLSPAVSL